MPKVAYPDSAGLASRILLIAERKGERSLQRTRVRVSTAGYAGDDENTLKSLCSRFTVKRWLFLFEVFMPEDCDQRVLHSVQLTLHSQQRKKERQKEIMVPPHTLSAAAVNSV